MYTLHKVGRTYLISDKANAEDACAAYESGDENTFPARLRTGAVARSHADARAALDRANAQAKETAEWAEKVRAERLRVVNDYLQRRAARKAADAKQGELL